MMIERLRRISYFLAYTVATIPLFHYIRNGRILALMIAVVTFAYVMVVLSSVQAAQPILSSEKAKTALPRWLPDRPKYHIWWMLVRRTLKWHLLLVPPKLGLALGFAEWLWIAEYSTMPTILKPYSYASHCTLDPTYPQWETILIGTSLIIVFSILESGLITSLISLSIYPSRVFILRLLIALIVLGTISQFREVYNQPTYFTQWCDLISCPYIVSNRLDAKISETVETSFFTLDDTGILLVANVMRPIYRSRYDGKMYYCKDNRPFIARQIVAGLLGLMLYAGATWGILWFVEDEEYQPAIE